VISVTDHGIGIPEEERSRATERFFRGETARSTPGSGLGLALVQAVATLHEGTLVLEDAAPGVRAVLRLAAVRPQGLTQASSSPHGQDNAAMALPGRS
jgi:signal transduction histidine kinase